MELTMLGTGHAGVMECYNTCFVISERDQHFLVDGGGGSAIFRQLRQAGIQWNSIHEIFVTHKHLDHLLGIFWMLRRICQAMENRRYKGEVRIYSHDEVIGILKDMSYRLFTETETACIGRTLHFIPVQDGEEKTVLGHKITFFDIGSAKAKQFGFCMKLTDEEKLTCCGDEPYQELEKQYVLDSKWLLHEAFCLFSQTEKYQPYEKHHSTVKDACQTAERLGIQNLILYHTEDQNLSERKKLYTEEGKQYYHGGLYIPDDLEKITLL